MTEPMCPGLGPKWQPLWAGGHHKVWGGAEGVDGPPEVPEK